MEHTRRRQRTQMIMDSRNELGKTATVTDAKHTIKRMQYRPATAHG